MTPEEIITQLRAKPLVTCSLIVAPRGIGLQFTETPPAEPGVYVVFQIDSERPFYVGETGNLFQRLTMLFRCRRSDNPHPCHTRHEQVYEEMPDCDTFCAIYSVKWLSTKGRFGRLEMEDALQTAFGTNTKAFYLNYDPDQAVAPPANHPPNKIGASTEGQPPDGDCPCAALWTELMGNPAYRDPHGVEIPTLGGRAAPLLFRVEDNDNGPQVHAWRPGGKPNFFITREQWLAICERFRQGIHEGLSFARGGVFYFTDPAWPESALGRINTPYAAAVFRHVWLAQGYRL